MDFLNDFINKDTKAKAANTLEGISGFVGKFVEQNLIEKSQREQNLKRIAKLIAPLVKHAIEADSSKSSPNLKLKIKKLENFKGDIPKYQTSGSSGFDVRAQLETEVVLEPGQRTLIPTGLSFSIPENFEIQVRPRSGLAIREGLSMVNTPGTIDADYRGEVKVIVINHGGNSICIKDQDRIAQFVVAPIIQPIFEVVEDLDETERADGGFGSTGISF